MSPNVRYRVLVILVSVVAGTVLGVLAVVRGIVVGNVDLGVVGGLLGAGSLVEAVFVVRLKGVRNVFRAGMGRCLRRGSVRRRKVAVPGGRLVRVAAALMAPLARRRWLEDVEVTLYDFAPEQHRALLRDFLAHAPAVIVVGWAAWAGQLPYALAGIRRHPRGPR